VLIVDDHPIFRDGMRSLLESVGDLEVAGEAATGEEAIRLAQAVQPDVILMDLNLPGLDGIEATRQIVRDSPRANVLVVTMYEDDESVFAALRAGARGYLTKDAEADELARAIQRVHEGKAMLDSDVQARLLDHLGGAPAGAQAPAHEAPVPGPPVIAGDLPDDLTSREAEVLALIAAGLSNAEIADRLVLSEATVKTHINRLFAKTGVRDRAQAVRYAYRNGLAEP
jgi:DNA-binding NarL/FixJ family response regulator